MSDIKETKLEVVHRLPNDLKTSPVFNVRPYFTKSGSEQDEDDAIKQMAATLERDGQLDPLIITPDNTVIIGHRRRKAAILINEKRTANGQRLFKLECKIDPNPSMAVLRRKGIISNVQRESLSPMDLALLIEKLRKDNHWEGPKHTAEVADYFGVSDATITETEKLLKYPVFLQQKIGRKVITAQSAKQLHDSVKDPEMQQKVLARAAEIQQEDTLDKYLDVATNNKVGHKEAHRKINAMMEKENVENPAIKKAIREMSHKPIARDQKEMLTSLATLDKDTYPKPAREFVRYMIYEFVKGVGDDDDLADKFQAIWRD